MTASADIRVVGFMMRMEGGEIKEVWWGEGRGAGRVCRGRRIVCTRRT